MGKSKARGPLASQPVCPRCFVLLDGFTCVSEAGAAPKPGDLSVCSTCASPLRFTDTLGLVSVSPFELEALEPEERETLAKATANVKAGWRN